MLRSAADRCRGWRAVALVLSLCFALGAVGAQPARLDRGRFTAVYYASDARLAASLLDHAVRTDTFPGVPVPSWKVLIMIAPDRATFRDWAGADAPEWGAALAFPESHRVVLQGRYGTARAGDPQDVLRHELAHLALHEYLGDLAPRWFDEGYASFAAREWSRDDMISANLALAIRGMPTFDQLDEEFEGGATSAQTAYALAFRAVAQLSAMNPRGLGPLLANWRAKQSLVLAMRATYGETLFGFEQRWRANTQRRYGALALAGDITVAGLVLLVVITPLYLVRRRRDRRRMQELIAADEAAERAARESALDALIAGSGPSAGPTE